MTRPAVLRHLESRVRGRADSSFRLRPHDLNALVDYVRELERGQVRTNPAHSVALDPEERVLGGLGAGVATDELGEAIRDNGYGGCPATCRLCKELGHEAQDCPHGDDGDQALSRTGSV